MCLTLMNSKVISLIKVILDVTKMSNWAIEHARKIRGLNIHTKAECPEASMNESMLNKAIRKLTWLLESTPHTIHPACKK